MINRERLVKTFCDLVKIDSPSGEEDEIRLELVRRLGDLGFAVQQDSYGNLIATEEGNNPLLLSAHMDTVEPGRGIKPSVDGDNIVSDGTTILGGDCKAGITAILEGLESIKEDGIDRIPVELVFSREEEVGLVGARNLDMSMLKATRGVVFDGNGPPSKITKASPTYISFKIDITGRAAHGGVEPEKGLSAVKIASELITQLPQGRMDDETTLNVGVISGGSVRNAVPEHASFEGEFRSRNIESLEMIKLDINNILEEARSKYPDAVIDETLNVEFDMYNLSDKDPMMALASDVITKMGMTPVIGPSGGGTDANIFNKKGVSCVCVGMGTRDMHTVREYVPILDLYHAALFCHSLLVYEK